MENIFKNAYFGKAYKTSNGNKALYSTASSFDKNVHWLLTQGGMLRWYSDGTPYGETSIHIVSEWQEPIDEEKLDELAWKNAETMDIPCRYEETAIEAYKAGYRKAMEK